MALLRAAFYKLLYDVCAGERYVNKCGDRHGLPLTRELSAVCLTEGEKRQSFYEF